MDEEKIRNSFQKIRQDIDFLKREIVSLRDDFSYLLKGLSDFTTSTQKRDIQTDNYTTSTDKSSFKPLKPQNSWFSTGNEGVPTDRQTNQQTDRQIINPLKNSKNTIENALEMLNSLDNAKKEIRLKFKKLTNQEILVFSALYQIEDEKGKGVSYKDLAERLGLTESSIRDYIGRLSKKGIPVDKTRLNNKSISLSVSPSLKKLASLSTILQLRDL